MTEPFPEEEVEELESVDSEGQVDHGDLEPTEEEAEEGNRLGREIDPDDDDSGGDPDDETS
jgi:hypothetical protein